MAIQCVLPKAPPSGMPTEPELASNAITVGDARLVCEQAQDFICEASAGATSILIQLSSLTKDKCDDVFLECRELNPVFTFQEFVRSPQALAYEADPTNVTLFEAYLDNPGTCTLGCFTELFSMNQLQTMQSELAAATVSAPTGVFQMNDGQFDTQNFCGDNAGPACIRTRGLCNTMQDGDFYKHPTCASGQAQWSRIDESLRIRYDGDETRGQAGKWLLETVASDLLSSGYGTEIARQPTFNPTPALGDTIWNLKCRHPNGIGGEYIQYRTKIVELVPCTCDSLIDCNGRGEAVGTKDTGPNCQCICDPDRAGEGCEIPLCQVPGILNGRQPACKEGGWIYPGGTCTPDCQEGYVPSHEKFTCDSEGAFLLPLGFTCNEVWVDEPPIDEFGNTPDFYESSTTTPPPECTDFDCVFHGQATKARREDGSCECICDEGYTGPQCRSIVGDCLAPLHKTIPNSALSTCEEGSRPNLVCTARCDETYYAVPATLECQGTELVPPKFRCFGGPTTQVLWCEMAQTISLVFSGVTAFGLMVACVCFQRNRIRSFNNILYHDKLFEAQQDVHGNFNVVRMTNGQEYHSKLPHHLLARDPRPPVEEDALRDAIVGESNWANWGQPTVDPMATALPVQDLREDTSTRTPPSAPSTQRPSLHDAGLPGQVSDALAIVADPGLRRGGEVVLRYIAGRPDLDGAHGWLLDFSHETGLCEVDLEGIEILKDIPIQCLEDATNVAAEQPHALAVSAPGPTMLDTNWLVQKRDLENKVEASRQERYRKFASEATKEESEKAARVKEALEQTEVLRLDLEERLRLGLRHGDAVLLRAAITETKELLAQKYLAIAPPSTLSALRRVLETAESRLEQFDAIQESRQRAQEYAERVRTGKAADWKMTSAELTRYVVGCNPERVQAGLKAQLPVFLRSSDGQRFTILHDACREACLDEPNSEKANNRIEVVRLLCEARANKNAVDMLPENLRKEMGGPRAKRHPSVRKLKESEEEPEEAEPAEAPREPEEPGAPRGHCLRLHMPTWKLRTSLPRLRDHLEQGLRTTSSV
ncbi:unnamed protein product [Symbiodinium natans]|uniref:EGF-like domain-containing protein n=1 Tax=Symbiodinium natans TaxID=878477 RepID=A0A812S2N7_9DINO|nr:unnamed protein product [Symbiodinium natans]